MEPGDHPATRGDLSHPEPRITATAAKNPLDDRPQQDHERSGLSTARALITLAWFHYESMVVAGMWSLLAVEAALRVRLQSEQPEPPKGREPPFIQLAHRAQREGLITDEWAERLDSARRMRNGLAHAQDQPAWTPGMAAPILAAAHEVIAVLYPDQ